MPMKSTVGPTEFITACEFHAKEIPTKMIEGEIILLTKLNETGRKGVHSTICEYEMGDPPTKCGNAAKFLIERGFPIQD